jgi:hypothetical protein
VSRLSLRTTQPSVQCMPEDPPLGINQSDREADRSYLSRTEVKNACSLPSNSSKYLNGIVLTTGIVFPSYYRECYSQGIVPVCGSLNTCSCFDFCERFFGAQSLKSIPQQGSLATSGSHSRSVCAYLSRKLFRSSLIRSYGKPKKGRKLWTCCIIGIPFVDPTTSTKYVWKL